MNDIKEVEKINGDYLFDDKIVSDILLLGRGFIADLKYKDAYQLAKILEEKIRSKSNQNQLIKAYSEYERLIYQLKTFALNFCTNNETVEIFEKGIAYSIGDLNINVLERLKAKLIEVFIKDRDVFRDRLKRALIDNKQILINHYIVLKETKVSGSIANILLDYIGSKGAETINKVEKADYLANSKNLKTLSASEKVNVKELLDIYDFLRLSSFLVDGIEFDFLFIDKQNNLNSISEGEVIHIHDKKVKEIKVKNIPQDFLAEATSEKSQEVIIIPEESDAESGVQQEIMTAYYGDQKQQKKINKEQIKLENKFKNDQPKVRDEFFKAVQKKDIIKTVAILRLLTQQGDLENFLEKDDKLNKFLLAIWQKRYGQEFALEFAKNPAQLKFSRLFLRYVLEERLGLARSDAARVGLQIGNIFVSLGKKDYNKMAYFDVGTKEFVWFE